MPEDVEIIGEAQLDRAIDQFTPELRGSIIAPALERAARAFREAVVASAKAMFQAKTGRLFSEIDTQVEIKDRPGGGAVIRWKIGMAKSNHAPYGRFWNEGFRHIGRGKGKRARLRRGQLQPGSKGFRLLRRDFMRPAFENAYRGIVDRFLAEVRSGVEQVASRIYRRVS